MDDTSRSINILHLDDEPDFVEMVVTFLEREDERFAVETATSVRDGLARLGETDVDCVVSDYDMPDMNGIEFLETVREDHPELPFILYTGKGSEEVASEAISAGVTDYLQKGTGTSQYAVLANRIRNAVEKYRAQVELKRREKRLALFFEKSPLGVIEWDEDAEVVRLNESASEILGYPEADLVGRSWTDLVHESEHDAFERAISDLLADEGGYHIVVENVRADGEVIICEWHNHVVTDEDGVVAVFSKFQDVTERRTRKRELEAQVTAMEAATDGLAILDSNQEYVYMNESHARIYGFEDPDDLFGKSWQACYDDETVARFEDRILPTLMAQGRWQDEMTVTNASGREFEQDLTLTALDDGRVVCVVRDLTDGSQDDRPPA